MSSQYCFIPKTLSIRQSGTSEIAPFSVTAIKFYSKWTSFSFFLFIFSDCSEGSSSDGQRAWVTTALSNSDISYDWMNVYLIRISRMIEWTCISFRMNVYLNRYERVSHSVCFRTHEHRARLSHAKSVVSWNVTWYIVDPCDLITRRSATNVPLYYLPL